MEGGGGGVMSQGVQGEEEESCMGWRMKVCGMMHASDECHHPVCVLKFKN